MDYPYSFACAQTEKQSKGKKAIAQQPHSLASRAGKTVFKVCNSYRLPSLMLDK